MVFSRFSAQWQRKALAVSMTVTLVLGIVSFAAFGQNPGQDDTITVDTSLVRLNVGVVDKKGHPITDLARGDFAIYEDDVRQDLKSFDMTTVPFSVVMLLDVSGSTKMFRQNLQLAAIRFLGALAPDDRVCVIAFDDKTDVLTKKFTSKRDELVFAINRANGKGGTQLYQALEKSLEQLKGEGNRRKAVVVLTDGVDTAMREIDRVSVGKATALDESVASIKPEQSAALSQVLNDADRQGVTIYPLALPTGDPKRLPDPNPMQIALYTAARARLQILADRSGGRLNAINRLEDMYTIYGEVAAELHTLYTVTYQSSNGESKRPDKWRAIRIDLDRPELLARTRQGYFAK